MKHTRIAISLAVLASSATVFGEQYMIDDFTTPQSFVVGGFEQSRTETLTGIDLSRAMFGMRTVSVKVEDNFFNEPLDMTIGQGLFGVVPRTPGTTFDMTIRYDAGSAQGVDMSVGHQIRFKTSQWSNDVMFGVIDIHGNEKVTTASSLNGSFRVVNKTSFGNTIDWSHIQTYKFSLGSLSAGTIVGETFLAVPEPGTLVVMALGLAGLARLRKRQ